MASQFKRRHDQSRENMKIVRKGQTSREVSPLFTQQTSNRKEREDQCFKFLEANELQKSMERIAKKLGQ